MKSAQQIGEELAGKSDRLEAELAKVKKAALEKEGMSGSDGQPSQAALDDLEEHNRTCLPDERAT